MRFCFATLAAALAAPSLCLASTLPYPAPPGGATVDARFGVQVADPFRAMEDVDSAAVREWVGAENAITHQYLDSVPQRAGLKRELQSMLADKRVTRRAFTYAGGHVFALKYAPPKSQPLVVVMDAKAALPSERVVLDLNVLDPSGKTSVDWFVPSLDGKLLAASLSENGSEDGHLVIYDVASGKALPDVVPRVQYPTGGGSVAWTRDGKSLYYTRYPQGNERPAADAGQYQQIYLHRLGTPAASDEYVLGRDFPAIAETLLSSSEDGRYTLADVSNGDGGEHAFYLRDGSAWRQIATNADGFRAAWLGRDDKIYALGLKGTPRGQVVAMDLHASAATLTNAPVVIPQSAGVIQSVVPTRHRLYVNYLVGGPSEIRVFKLDGSPLGPLAASPLSDVSVGARLADDAILFSSESYTRAFAWYLLDPASHGDKPTRMPLSDVPGFAVDGGIPNAVAEMQMVKSSDGVEVPLVIVHNKDLVPNGQAPVLLTGYGGFGISLTPQFSSEVALWLRHGGVFAVANLRGGGEFGETWHTQGMLTHKQQVFDDFIACARHLEDAGLTSPEHLAIMGGSNGGLLMGAVIVQAPQLFRVAVSSVGLYDMVRFDHTPNGIFNVTEYGDPNDETQFKALYAYSPYHHVKDGTDYPAILLTTGEHDGRVAPWMSYKMTARLQAANPNGKPILLRVAADQGHGFGTSLGSRIEEEADMFTFLVDQLQMQ